MNPHTRLKVRWFSLGLLAALLAFYLPRGARLHSQDRGGAGDPPPAGRFHRPVAAAVPDDG